VTTETYQQQTNDPDNLQIVVILFSLFYSFPSISHVPQTSDILRMVCKVQAFSSIDV